MPGDVRGDLVAPLGYGEEFLRRIGHIPAIDHKADMPGQFRDLSLEHAAVKPVNHFSLNH